MRFDRSTGVSDDFDRKRWLWIPLVMVLALAAVSPVLGAASAAPDAQVVHSATVTIPVPPASNYAGSGGGDGWAVALTPTAVYNVFHHSGSLGIACHLQADASPCWSPKTIRDASGNDFATSSTPGLWLDQGSGHLFVYATRTSDATGGVVCIDTTQPVSTLNPFCGFAALTAVGDAPTNRGISAISEPAVVGTNWFAFNYVSGVAVTGTENKLLCFSLVTFSPCASQPFSVNIGSGTLSDGFQPPPAVAAIGTQVVISAGVGGNDMLACFDASANGTCAGVWPLTLTFNYAEVAGAAFPFLSSAGAVTGLCLPTSGDPCFSLAGASVATPPGLASAVTPNLAWNGPPLVLGPRVYVPNFNVQGVDCFDFSTGAGCPNFPKRLENLGNFYTVNADPARPSCIWVNADNGSAQIQNFDAFTGGACGSGAIRVLSSTVIVPNQLCTPTTWNSLQVQAPPRSTYSSGSIAFQDAGGTPVAGAADRPLDANGTADLTGLNLSGGSGRPQFLITLLGATRAPSSVVVKVTWTATDDPTCGAAAPVALPQSVSTAQNTAVPITLTATDANNDALTYSVVAPPAHGTLSGTAPNLTYTPAAGFSGADSFTFKANDGTLDSNVATVTITVGTADCPPHANDQSGSTNQDTALAIGLTGSDPNMDPITFAAVSGPLHGTLSGTAPNLTYTPAPGYSGPDSFTFKSNDGKLDSNIATVSITVLPVNPNHPPTADPQCVTTPMDSAVPIKLTGSDPDGDAIIYAIVTGPAHGTLSGSAPSLTYTPAAGYSGPDSFTFTVNDGHVISTVTQVSITVTKPQHVVTCHHHGKRGQGNCTWWHVPHNHDRLKVHNAGQGWVKVTIWVNGNRLYFGKITHGTNRAYNLARYLKGNGRDDITIKAIGSTGASDIAFGM